MRLCRSVRSAVGEMWPNLDTSSGSNNSRTCEQESQRDGYTRGGVAALLTMTVPLKGEDAGSATQMRLTARYGGVVALGDTKRRAQPKGRLNKETFVLVCLTLLATVFCYGRLRCLDWPGHKRPSVSTSDASMGILVLSRRPTVALSADVCFNT